MEKERECYEEEVQPYRKTDYKPIIYIAMGSAMLCYLMCVVSSLYIECCVLYHCCVGVFAVM